MEGTSNWWYRELPITLSKKQQKEIENRLMSIRDRVSVIAGRLSIDEIKNKIYRETEEAYTFLMDNPSSNLEELLNTFEIKQEESLSNFRVLYGATRDLNDIRSQLKAYEILNIEVSQFLSETEVIRYDIAIATTDLFRYRAKAIMNLITENGQSIVSRSIKPVVEYNRTREGVILARMDREFLFYHYNIRL